MREEKTAVSCELRVAGKRGRKVFKTFIRTHLRDEILFATVSNDRYNYPAAVPILSVGRDSLTRRKWVREP